MRYKKAIVGPRAGHGAKVDALGMKSRRVHLTMVSCGSASVVHSRLGRLCTAPSLRGLDINIVPCLPLSVSRALERRAARPCTTSGPALLCRRDLFLPGVEVERRHRCHLWGVAPVVLLQRARDATAEEAPLGPKDPGADPIFVAVGLERAPRL